MEEIYINGKKEILFATIIHNKKEYYILSDEKIYTKDIFERYKEVIKVPKKLSEMISGKKITDAKIY